MTVSVVEDPASPIEGWSKDDSSKLLAVLYKTSESLPSRPHFNKKTENICHISYYVKLQNHTLCGASYHSHFRNSHGHWIGIISNQDSKYKTYSQYITKLYRDIGIWKNGHKVGAGFSKIYGDQGKQKKIWTSYLLKIILQHVCHLFKAVLFLIFSW